jgi:hypothetical protein
VLFSSKLKTQNRFFSFHVICVTMSFNEVKTMTLDLQTLERWLWDSADIFRGSTGSSDFKNYIFGLLFLKRANRYKRGRGICKNPGNLQGHPFAGREKQQSMRG